MARVSEREGIGVGKVQVQVDAQLYEPTPDGGKKLLVKAVTLCTRMGALREF